MEHNFLPSSRLGGHAINDNEFDRRLTNPLYLQKKEADRVSYNWDGIINYLESLAKKQGFEEGQQDREFEIGMQVLASRRRVERRWLSRSLLDALTFKAAAAQRRVRGHLTDNNETAIVFSVLHNYSESGFGTYRDAQHLLMRLYAIQLTRRNPNLKTIVLLAFESLVSRQFQSIMMMVVLPQEEEMSEDHDDLIAKLRIFSDLETGVHTEKEYPDQSD